MSTSRFFLLRDHWQRGTPLDCIPGAVPAECREAALARLAASIMGEDSSTLPQMRQPCHHGLPPVLPMLLLLPKRRKKCAKTK